MEKQLRAKPCNRKPPAQSKENAQQSESIFALLFHETHCNRARILKAISNRIHRMDHIPWSVTLAAPLKRYSSSFARRFHRHPTPTLNC